MIIKRTKSIIAVIVTTLVTGCSPIVPDVNISSKSDDNTESSITIGKNSESGNVSISDNSGDINIQKKSSNSNNVIINGNSGNININGSSYYSTDMEEILDEKEVKTENVLTKTGIEEVKTISFDEKNINVNIYPSDSNDIELKLSGTTPKDADVKLATDLYQSILCIMVDGDSSNCNLTCSIGIPKKEFKEIYINTKNGNITALGDGEIKTKIIMLSSQNGNIKTDIVAEAISINTGNGNITNNIIADKNVTVSISTDSGNIKTDLQNVNRLSASIYTKAGNIKNDFTPNGEYTIDGAIHTFTGNIKIN